MGKRHHSDGWELVSRCRICGAEFTSLDGIKAHMATHDKSLVKVLRIELSMSAGDETTRIPCVRISSDTLPDHTVKGLVGQGAVATRGGFCPVLMLAYARDEKGLREAWEGLRTKVREASEALLANADMQFGELMERLDPLPDKVGEACGEPAELKVGRREIDFWIVLAKSGRLSLPQEVWNGVRNVGVGKDDVMHEWGHDFRDGVTADFQVVTSSDRVFFRMIWFEDHGEADPDTDRTDGRREILRSDASSPFDVWRGPDGKHDIRVVVYEEGR